MEQKQQVLETKPKGAPPEVNLVAYTGEGKASTKITVGLWEKQKDGKIYFSGKTDKPIPENARLFIFKNILPSGTELTLKEVK